MNFQSGYWFYCCEVVKSLCKSVSRPFLKGSRNTVYKIEFKHINTSRLIKMIGVLSYFILTSTSQAAQCISMSESPGAYNYDEHVSILEGTSVVKQFWTVEASAFEYSRNHMNYTELRDRKSVV